MPGKLFHMCIVLDKSTRKRIDKKGNVVCTECYIVKLTCHVYSMLYYETVLVCVL